MPEMLKIIIEFIFVFDNLKSLIDIDVQVALSIL